MRHVRYILCGILVFFLVGLTGCDKKPTGPDNPSTEGGGNPGGNNGGNSGGSNGGNNGGSSGGGQSTTCSYKLLGYRWARTSNFSKVVMTFSTSFPSSWNQAALSAMAEWHWHSDALIEFRYHTNPRQLGVQLDGYNAICYGAVTDGALGTAHYWLQNGYLTEVDVVLGNREKLSTSGQSGTYDIRSILTHEFGHVWGLDDLYSSSARDETMYGRTAPGNTRPRTLHCGDKQGVQKIYGYGTRSKAAPNVEDEPGILIPDPPDEYASAGDGSD